jgi:hypothetical protein
LAASTWPCAQAGDGLGCRSLCRLVCAVKKEKGREGEREGRRESEQGGRAEGERWAAAERESRAAAVRVATAPAATQFSSGSGVRGKEERSRAERGSTQREGEKAGEVRDGEGMELGGASALNSGEVNWRCERRAVSRVRLPALPLCFYAPASARAPFFPALPPVRRVLPRLQAARFPPA